MHMIENIICVGLKKFIIFSD